jgi:hypothetical protein
MTILMLSHSGLIAKRELIYTTLISLFIDVIKKKKKKNPKSIN